MTTLTPDLRHAAAAARILARHWRDRIDHVCQTGTTADIVAADLEMQAARLEAEALAREATA